MRRIQGWLVTEIHRRTPRLFHALYGPHLGPHPTLAHAWRKAQRSMREPFTSSRPEWGDL